MNNKLLISLAAMLLFTSTILLLYKGNEKYND